MIVIDGDKITISGKDIPSAEYGIGTPEAFRILSGLWLRSGWDTKYVYSFTWLGRPMIQLPEDMIRLQEVICAVQPDVIVETGVAHGGSLIFYASLCRLLGKGRVVGVDIEIREHNRRAIESHSLASLITLIEGDSATPQIAEKVRAQVAAGEKVMILLDSCHTKEHVLRELQAFAPMVTPGSYIVAMDGIMEQLAGAPRSQPDWAVSNPRQAALEFVAAHAEFEMTEPAFQFNEGSIRERVTYWPNAFLRRKQGVEKRVPPAATGDAAGKKVQGRPGSQQERIMTKHQKLVSIGLPVYNGENFLRQALESLLAQDYRHFELIVSDNGSKDGTEAIGREFQARDARVRYIRHSENRGSPWNFKYVAQEARGAYFLWAAHDDLWSPSFLGKCVAMLEEHPEAVLCCTEINFINGQGQPSRLYQNYSNIETLGKSRPGRIHELISRMGWFALYGLMRTEATRKISLGMSAFGYDVILLLELLMQGDFAKVREPLFSFRILNEAKTAADYQQDFQSAAPAPKTPYAGMAKNLLKTVYQAPLSSTEKAEVFADFIQTLTRENPPWRENITAELLGADAKLEDSQFAFLLGLMLNGAVPLDEIQGNPVSEAIYRAPLGAPDLLQAARQVLGKAKPAAAESHQELLRRASLLIQQGRLEEASDAFEEALQKQETSDNWSNWATVQLARNRTDAAEQGLRRALRLDPENGLAAAKLGVLLANMGRLPESIALLEKSIPRIDGAQRTTIEGLLSEYRKKIETCVAV
jgi:cephalosporin hydroxylase/glycosyltransferase involved in cell wall biosynthesis